MIQEFYMAKVNNSSEAQKSSKGYFEEALSLSRQGKKEEAIRAYDKAIELNPDSTEAYNNKGNALRDLGKNVEAIRVYDKAIELNPDNVAAYNGKGNALCDLGRKEEGIRAFDKSIELKPDNAIVYYNKGLALQALGKNVEAIRVYDKAIELKPDFAMAYNNQGNVLRDLGKNVEAIRVYDKAIELKPGYAAAYNNKGNALQALGRNAEALRAYDKAIELKPDDALYHCSKGRFLNILGKEREALCCFNKAYELVQSGRFENNLNVGKKKYINEAISQDRIVLIEKLTLLQKTTIEAQEALNAIEDSARAAKVKANFNILKAAINVTTREAIDRLVNKEKTAFSAESASTLKLMIDYQKKLAELQTEIAQVKQEQALQGQKIDHHEAKLDVHEKTIETHEHILDKSGAKERAEVKAGFDAAAIEGEEFSIYLKTFYWTVLNMFGAYRNLGTGLIQGNIDNDESIKESLLIKGAKKLASFGADIASGIPVIGSILGVMDSIIDTIYTTVKERRFEDRVNKINKIIQSKLGLEDDISIKLAKVSLALLEIRKEEILYPTPPKPTSGLKDRMELAKSWLTNKIDAIKDKVLPNVVHLHDQSNLSVQLALKDAALIIAYMIKHYDEIIRRKDPLEKQIAILTKNGSIDTILSESSANLAQQDQPEQEGKILQLIPVKPQPKLPSKTISSKETKTAKCSSCVLLAVKEIEYDNPILNSENMQELLTTAKQNYGTQGINRLLKLGTTLSREEYAEFQALRQTQGNKAAIDQLFAQVHQLPAHISPSLAIINYMLTNDIYPLPTSASVQSQEKTREQGQREHLLPFSARALDPSSGIVAGQSEVVAITELGINSDMMGDQM